MMRNTSRMARWMALSALWVLSTGCMTVDMSTIWVHVPLGEDASRAKGVQVYLRSVADHRKFQSRPATPDTPSLASEVASLNEQDRKRVIGRIRDRTAEPLGNIFTETQQTVETIVADALASGLNGAGYSVVTDKSEARTDALVMDVTVDQFWGWVNVDGTQAWLEGAVQTNIHISGKGHTAQRILIGANTSHQLAFGATRRAWVSLFNHLMENFVEDVRNDFTRASDKMGTGGNRLSEIES